MSSISHTTVQMFIVQLTSTKKFDLHMYSHGAWHVMDIINTATNQ